MSKITNTQIASFRDIGSLYLRATKKPGKLYHAVDKMVKKLKSLHEKFLDEQADLRTDHAAINSESKSKELLKNDRGEYSYTPEKEKELRKKLRELNNKEVEIEPHIVAKEDLPDDFEFDYIGGDGGTYTASHYDVVKAFEGIVIEKSEEDE